MFERSSGVLLHVSSLPGGYGIGDLGPSAHAWVDWLASAGCRYWQFLPLGPTGFGDSPYSSLSSAAGNINLISPELLVEDGLLAEQQPGPANMRVDYLETIRQKWSMVERAHAALSGDLQSAFEDFKESEANWLDDYTLFMALKTAHGDVSWVDWPDDLRRREPASLGQAKNALADQIAVHAFGQFIFYRQLEKLRAVAESRGVELIGDVPLYVAADSVDVWVAPELFTVDASTGRPDLIAGVPPDMFSPNGQWWGNPLYRWDAHAADGYAWWSRRLGTFRRHADVLRLDHFTGFVRYYEIEATAPDAMNGVWREGPGLSFFTSVSERLGELKMILEDLGPIPDPVEELRLKLGYPGMKLLQEAFDGDEHNQFLPENYPDDCVVYTGTHDNDTARGRFESEDDRYRAQALAYTGAEPDTFAWELVSTAWGSSAVIAITPVQDLLQLGSEARMNYPGTAVGNWNWRMTEAASEELAGKVLELNRQSGRSI